MPDGSCDDMALVSFAVGDVRGGSMERMALAVGEGRS